MLHCVNYLNSVSFLRFQEGSLMLLAGICGDRGRWLQFDNGVQVSLGNRRDLTQDAELPLGFFYAPSPFCLPCIPAFLSRVFMAFFLKDMTLLGWGRRSVLRVRWKAEIVISFLVMWMLYFQYCTSGAHSCFSFNFLITHYSDVSPCVMWLIDRDSEAILKVWHCKVRNSLAARVIILRSNLSYRK